MKNEPVFAFESQEQADLYEQIYRITISRGVQTYDQLFDRLYDHNPKHYIWLINRLIETKHLRAVPVPDGVVILPL